MKRWAVVIAILYVLMLAILLLPVSLLAFMDKADANGIAGTYGKWPYWHLGQVWDSQLFDATTGIVGQWQWWLWLAVMGLAQVALLALPVRLASRRPMTRSPLVLTVLAAALMMGLLVCGAFCSLYEFAYRGEDPWKLSGWTAPALGVTVWCAWALIFFRLGRNAAPEDLVSRLCKYLFRGSILELLIAVPTHIVARYRDYCCAGFMTFIGLTLGMSVMLFSFGPGVFFLFAARWRRLHPGNHTDRGESDRHERTC